MKPDPLAGRVVMFASHHATTGPADALEEHAGQRARRLVAVYHAFPYAAVVESRVRRWRDGELASERRFRWSARVPGPITWVKEVVQTVWWGLRTPARVDVFVGIDSLNALAGIVLRALRKARFVVFWTIDYAPKRFSNPTLNAIYHAIDRFCVRRCDETWNLSPRMADARRARGIVAPQRVVPMGAYARPAREPAEPHRVVFMGSLLEKQGVQHALHALPIVRAEVPDARLLVIGDGPFRLALERIAGELDLDSAVEFSGYVEDHRQVEELIAGSGVALAVYDPQEAGFTYFADPGKIKNYLAMGVPVVATDVAWSARWLADEGAGALVEYEPESIARGILRLLDDASARTAASDLGALSDWRAVFDGAFRSLLLGPVDGAAYDLHP
jgi:glycosyltransferase involved in cell wall biosynthesis